MVAHPIVRPLSRVVPLRIFNPGEEAVMAKKGVTIASVEQLEEAKNHNMCILCDTKTRRIHCKTSPWYGIWS